MGRSSRSGRRKKRRPGAATTPRERKAAKDDPESLSVEELVAAAAAEMDAFQYEAAQTLCRVALAKEPDNVAVLETSAGLCLELGNLDGARHCLGRAITLQPDQGHEKYMSMAQLMASRDALQCYLKGIEILTRAIAKLPATEKKGEEEGGKKAEEEGVAMTTEEEGSQITAQGNENLAPEEAIAGGSRGNLPPLPPTPGSTGGERAGLVRQVSTAYCSVAELFMTDLCDEEEAEEECRRSITKAIEADPTNPEAYQHMVRGGEGLRKMCMSVDSSHFIMKFAVYNYVMVCGGRGGPVNGVEWGGGGCVCQLIVCISIMKFTVYNYVKCFIHIYRCHVTLVVALL